MRTLRENEYIWAVSVELEDGHRGNLAYFDSLDKANHYANERPERDVKVVQVTLWQCNDGGYYAIDYMTRISVNGPLIRQDALAKLTAEERRILGL